MRVQNAHLGKEDVGGQQRDQRGNHGGHELEHEQLITALEMNFGVGITGQRAGEEGTDQSNGGNLHRVEEELQEVDGSAEEDLVASQRGILGNPLNGEGEHVVHALEGGGNHPEERHNNNDAAEPD